MGGYLLVPRKVELGRILKVNLVVFFLRLRVGSSRGNLDFGCGARSRGILLDLVATGQQIIHIYRRASPSNATSLIDQTNWSGEHSNSLSGGGYQGREPWGRIHHPKKRAPRPVRGYEDDDATEKPMSDSTAARPGPPHISRMA